MTAMRLALATAVCGLSYAATTAADYRAPSLSADGVVNAASGQATFAPYSICTIYGDKLYLNGAVSASGSSEIPNQLAGVSVLIGLVRAGIFYVSANQINLLIPNSVMPGAYSVTVVRDGAASQAVPVVVQEAAPGLFPVALHANGTPVTAGSPASPGEIVLFYGTGFGRARPDPADRAIAPSAAPIIHAGDFQLLLDGTAIDPALVLYTGVAPMSAGLYQVNVRLPDDLPPTNPHVQVSVAGVVSPGVTLFTTPANYSSSPPPDLRAQPPSQ
jgi:uncharacterized protein (TIGR03437 family)